MCLRVSRLSLTFLVFFYYAFFYVLSFLLRTWTDCSLQKVECNFQLIMEVNAENNFEFVCIGPLRKLRHISNYHIEITTALKKILISFERKFNNVF